MSSILKIQIILFNAPSVPSAVLVFFFFLHDPQDIPLTFNISISYEKKINELIL